MPLTDSQRNKLNTFLSRLVAKITDLQDSYYKGFETIVPAGINYNKITPAITRQRKHYWQGRRQAVSAVDWTNKPTDQKESWADLGLTSTSLPDHTGIESLSIQIDVYDGPWGRGWIARLKITFSGDTFERVFNFGPESYRDSLWSKVTNQ